MLFQQIFTIGATFAVVASALPAPIIPGAQNINLKREAADDEAWEFKSGALKQREAADDEAWEFKSGALKREAADDEAWEFKSGALKK